MYIILVTKSLLDSSGGLNKTTTLVTTFPPGDDVLDELNVGKVRIMNNHTQ